MIRRFLRNEAGATAIEYSVIAGMISIVIVGVVKIIGTDVSDSFQRTLAIWGG